jgi:hypothetical protein
LAEVRLDDPQNRQNDKVAFYPNMPAGVSTYFFNLGALIPGLTRRNPCTLFESETDYVRVTPRRIVGADGIGNHIGYQIFGDKTYTFWISFCEQNYILPHKAGDYNWEAQIVCVVQ